MDSKKGSNIRCNKLPRMKRRRQLPLGGVRPPRPSFRWRGMAKLRRRKTIAYRSNQIKRALSITNNINNEIVVFSFSSFLALLIGANHPISNPAVHQPSREVMGCRSGGGAAAGSSGCPYRRRSEGAGALITRGIFGWISARRAFLCHDGSLYSRFSR